MLNEIELQQEIKHLKKQIENKQKNLQKNREDIQNLEHVVTKSNEFGRSIENYFSEFVMKIRNNAVALNPHNTFGEKYREGVRNLLNSPQNRGAINTAYDTAYRAGQSIRKLKDGNYSLDREIRQLEQQLYECKQQLKTLQMKKQ